MPVALINSYWLPTGVGTISFEAGNYIVLSNPTGFSPAPLTGVTIAPVYPGGDGVQFYVGVATSTETNITYSSGFSLPMLLQVFSGVQAVSLQSFASETPAYPPAYSFPPGSFTTAELYGGFGFFSTLSDSGSSGMTQVQSSTYGSGVQFFNTGTLGSAETGLYTITNIYDYWFFTWLTLIPYPLITASPSAVVCSNVAAGSVLTWYVYGATSCTVAANGVSIGTFSGPLGSLVVYPYVTTTYTVTGNGATGNATTIVTAAPNILCATIDGNTAWVNSGAYYAPGVYAISYLCGGYENAAGTFQVNNSKRPNMCSTESFKIVTTNGNAEKIDAPGNYVPYSSLVNAVAGNAASVQYMYHDGGPIGIYLDLPSYTGLVMSYPPLLFCVSGPGPSPNISASSPTIMAGQSVEISWSAFGATSLTIDNGIGVQASPGSTSLSPTTPGLYTVNATASYNSVNVSTYCQFLIGTPSMPSLFTATPQVGTVELSWGPNFFTTETLIERSTSPTAGFSQIGVSTTTSYTDTPPALGTTFYYRARGTDGFNYSNYTSVLASASIVVPAPPAISLTNSVAPSPNNPLWSIVGVISISFETVAGATSYEIFRGYVPGGESITPLVTLADPGLGDGIAMSYSDLTAGNGNANYYIAKAVNTAGASAASNEVFGYYSPNCGGLTVTEV